MKGEPFPIKCPACRSADLIQLDGEEAADGTLPITFLCGHCLHGFSGTASSIHEVFWPRKTKEKK